MNKDYLNKLDFRSEGTELKITRMYDSDRDHMNGEWVVVNEDGIGFKNQMDSDGYSVKPLVAAALCFNDERRVHGRNFNVTIDQDVSLSRDFYDDIVTVYLMNPPKSLKVAMDHNGDYGIGSTYPEAVYNTNAVIRQMD